MEARYYFLLVLCLRSLKHSRFIVDFPRIDGAEATRVAELAALTALSPNSPLPRELYRIGRESNVFNHTEGGVDRYMKETVRINLRTFASVSGKGITKWPNP